MQLIFIIIAARVLAHLRGTWLQGEHGEMDVEDELKKLPEGYHYLGSLVIGGRANIDNVVVGPTGVWVLEVKSHQRLSYDFLMRKTIGQVWAETYAVRDVLRGKLGCEVRVQPVIVYSSIYAKVRFGKKQIRGVYIVGIKWLNDLVQNTMTSPLRPEEVEQIGLALKQYQE